MTDRAAMQLVQQISQIDNRRREMMMQEKEVSTRLDALRQEQVAKLGQLRHTDDRLHSLRAAVQALQVSAAASKEFASDATSRVEKARIEEPVLLRVATDSRDAATEELERWKKGVESADTASSAWGIGGGGEQQNNNNKEEKPDDDKNTAKNQDAATSSTSKHLQKEIARIESDISASQQKEAACRAQVAKLAQETLELRGAIKEISDSISSLSSSNIIIKNLKISNGLGADSASSNNDEGGNKQANALKSTGDQHAVVVERLRHEIEDAEAKHARQTQQPQREVDTLVGRIKELSGWVDDTKMQVAAARAAVEDLTRRKTVGLCSVCSA